jgi:hypothetical protein
VHELQAALSNIFDWSVTWGMEFNVKKCPVLHIGRSNPGHTYTMGGQRLAVSMSERDVGVTICYMLKPSEQCRKAAAYGVLSQIHRSFHYHNLPRKSPGEGSEISFRSPEQRLQWPLAELMLASLSARWDEVDMVLTNKMLSDSTQWFEMADTRRPTR